MTFSSTWNGLRRSRMARGKPIRRGKPMRTQKPREGSRRAIKQELDKLVRLIVIPRDGACVCCGSKQNLEVGHFFSRANVPIRWSLVNCNVQCHDCNMRHNSNPSRYLAYMIRVHGWEGIDRLNELRWANEYITKAELIELRDELKAKVKEGLCAREEVAA